MPKWLRSIHWRPIYYKTRILFQNDFINFDSNWNASVKSLLTLLTGNSEKLVNLPSRFGCRATTIVHLLKEVWFLDGIPSSSYSESDIIYCNFLIQFANRLTKLITRLQKASEWKATRIWWLTFLSIQYCWDWVMGLMTWPLYFTLTHYKHLKGA